MIVENSEIFDFKEKVNSQLVNLIIIDKLNIVG